MDEATRNLIFKAIDQTIVPAEFDRLQDAIEQDDEVRAEYLRAVTLCESLSEIASEASEPNAIASRPAHDDRTWKAPAACAVGAHWQSLSWSMIGLAATILLTVGGAAFWFGLQKSGTTNVADRGEQSVERNESQIAGHATLRRSVDLKWSAGGNEYRDGDVLTNGRLQFEEGVAEIDFFCGATLIVEGPAALNIESDWSVKVASGRLRANVPPAARGFIVKAAGSEIIDLGTEFALEVKSENARVEVIDGELEIRGGEHDGSHLLTGERQWLKGADTAESFDGLSTIDELKSRQENAASERFAAWQAHAEELRQDDRLIAYFPIAAGQHREPTALAAGGDGGTELHTGPDANAFGSRTVRNVARTGDGLNGKLIGPVEHSSGRFGSKSSGLNFGRPGSRVRTRIDGEYQAFSFACWVRIDGLEHVYNALFMSDGYETGELHWQIRNDGRLMFSVMVDDTQKIRRFSELDQREVETAGLARVYYSDPIWDISKSGQWFHLAAVYDPAGRQVMQYANGKQVGSHEILDKFHIDTLRIGAAEIGNWGQPFRKTPWFSVRNLNGTIDELAIFDAALTSEEITTLFQNGKPLGY
ncbi:LamG-like jellyroll fold domain-containing protein [Fuerstiella marisgermanici]|uniref:FecR protein n=1 Tax=Fuerstiella marisgermanici TaxID=1891926 RepID=A0A1P8W8Z6_9PLAN|nr:LamG-like jellyroll fold domain-containing protein [Fuerstiella marisgermanici]APZ90527.1 FecR protein [Fuerstiella marisgermanici]